MSFKTSKFHALRPNARFTAQRTWDRTEKSPTAIVRRIITLYSRALIIRVSSCPVYQIKQKWKRQLQIWTSEISAKEITVDSSRSAKNKKVECVKKANEEDERRKKVHIRIGNIKVGTCQDHLERLSIFATSVFILHYLHITLNAPILRTLLCKTRSK